MPTPAAPRAAGVMSMWKSRPRPRARRARVAVRHADDHRARGGHPGPAGRPAGLPPQRLLPGGRGLPRGRGHLRADRDRGQRPDRGQAGDVRGAPKGLSEAAWPIRCATPMRRSVRTAAAGASSLTEFLERLRDDGVFRERHSERNPGEITGYAVASPDSVDSTGKPIYYGGGKLAADLTLPKLRRRWEVATPQDAADIAGDGPRAAQSSRSAGTASAPEGAGGGREGSAGEDRHAVTLGERAQICEQATAAAARATEQTQRSNFEHRHRPAPGS